MIITQSVTLQLLIHLFSQIIKLFNKKGTFLMINPQAPKITSNNGVTISGVQLGGAAQATALNVAGTPAQQLSVKGIKNPINEGGASINSAAIGSAPKFSPRAANALKLVVNKKESSNFNSAEHSDRINEEYNILFGFEGAACIPNEDPISSSYNNMIADRKMFFTTESCVSRYTSLFNILENRSNPLLRNKGQIQSRVFKDFQQQPTFNGGPDGHRYHCDCQLSTCQVCLQRAKQSNKNVDGFVSRKDRPTRRDIIDGEQNDAMETQQNMFFLGNGRETNGALFVTAKLQHRETNQRDDDDRPTIENRKGKHQNPLGSHSAQQGIQRDQGSEKSSNLSKSIDSQKLRQHLSNNKRKSNGVRDLNGNSGEQLSDDEEGDDNDGANAHRSNK
ncbi:hypothetical protein FGO68_gene16706 [Halteria grandinella]|uniref:Uncharacterized protein n=1 Tax=Halteria grandinella TaxID=5974 RepID=A0A8J8P8R7_HALGN|nr:hypothetical protein FGO68_gene16706 [Halteria grandinella]